LREEDETREGGLDSGSGPEWAERRRLGDPTLRYFGLAVRGLQHDRREKEDE
jgi:hypothetical protein